MTEDQQSDIVTLAIEKEVAQQLNIDNITNKFASTDKNFCQSKPPTHTDLIKP